MKFVILILLLMGCNNNAETSSGSPTPDQSNAMLTGLLGDAYDLVKNDYDFSEVYIVTGEAGGNLAVFEFRVNRIVVNTGRVENNSPQYVGCLLVAELQHFIDGENDINEPRALKAGRDCLDRFGVRS